MDDTARTLTGGDITLLIDVKDVKPGSDQTLVVNASINNDTEQLGSTKVNVNSLPLTVSPSTAVVGREVTVTGSGFSIGGSVSEITIGKVTYCDSVENGAPNCAIQVASGGRVIAAFSIPNEAALAEADDYTITVTDSGGRIGTGTVTTPEPTLTVEPAESRIGSTITLSGTGWPSATGASLVGLYYDGVQYASATAGSDGTWTGFLTVPNAAGVGSRQDVEAKATVGDRKVTGNLDNVSKKEDHRTPAAIVTLSSAQAQRGTTITVSGSNFNTFQTVKVEIGTSDVTPAPAPTTDGDGSFSARVLVPGLDLGSKNLKVTVSDVPVVEFLEIVATPVSTTMTSADAFADLVAADNLIVVWYFDNDTKGWSFYDPRPEVAAAVDLNMVASGDNVWIQITTNQEFQGDMLTAGWNLVTLD